jgi:hypothetical protein
VRHLVQERTTRANKKPRLLKPALKSKPRIDLYVVKSFKMDSGIGTMALAGYPAKYAEMAKPDTEMAIWFAQNPYRKVIVYQDKYYDVQKYEYDLVTVSLYPTRKKIGSKILTVVEIHLPQETIDWLVLKVGEVL